MRVLVGELRLVSAADDAVRRLELISVAPTPIESVLLLYRTA